jgi:rhodanese-related sulfurtransferase
LSLDLILENYDIRNNEVTAVLSRRRRRDENSNAENQNRSHPMPPSKSITTHHPHEVHQLLGAGDAVLVDVREPDEHAAEAIVGAHLRPLSSFDPANLPDCDGKKLILHCKKGGRSAQALARCLAAGVTDISHLEGGIDEWRAAGLPVRTA